MNIDTTYLYISAWFIGTALAIVIYGTIRCKVPNFKDPLTTKLAPPPWDKFFDGWGLSHFAFFGLLAYMYPKPQYLVFIAIVGVLWEIIESIFHDHPFYLSKCNYKLDTDNADGWWYGRWQDIVMNTTGMLTGLLLRKVR